MGFGVMAALRIYAHRHIAAQRHIQLTKTTFRRIGTKAYSIMCVGLVD